MIYKFYIRKKGDYNDILDSIFFSDLFKEVITRITSDSSDQIAALVTS